MSKLLKIVSSSLFIASIALQQATAQSVSFGHSGGHIPRKLIKLQKQEQKDIKRKINEIRDNINDTDYVTKMNLELKTHGQEKNLLRTGDAGSAEVAIAAIQDNYSPKVLTRKALRRKIRALRDSLGHSVGTIKSMSADSIISIYMQNKSQPDTVATYGNNVMEMYEDTLQRQGASFREVKILLRKNYNSRDFFPATYASEAINFFTSRDTLASKFFNDNSLAYNSSKQKLAYSSEAYADYFGPIRLGLGYTITSASSDFSTYNKSVNDAAQKLVTNGGNLNYNVSYPVVALGNGGTLSYKAYVSTKGGVDIPKDSASASTYGFLTTTGLVNNVYTKGYMNVIQLFFTSRISYVYGNRNFENHLRQNNFWLWQNSLGIAIKDKFRIRLDVYDGLSGSVNKQFVRENFPVTVSFDIVNPF